MKKALLLLFTILSCLLVYFIDNENMPSINPFIENKGFKIGQCYEVTPINASPFLNKRDTLCVKDIKFDYVLFTDNTEIRLGSLGAKLFNYKKINK